MTPPPNTWNSSRPCRRHRRSRSSSSSLRSGTRHSWITFGKSEAKLEEGRAQEEGRKTSPPPPPNHFPDPSP